MFASDALPLFRILRVGSGYDRLYRDQGPPTSLANRHPRCAPGVAVAPTKNHATSCSPTMASSTGVEKDILSNHPQLRSLVLRNVTLTGRTIGCGSYGSVEEVAISGALCAAKKIHEFLTKRDPKWLAREVADKNVEKFLLECTMLSGLRHPHIVQFFGLWFDDSGLYLVMEKMMMSLHDMLTPGDQKSCSSPNIPSGLKYTILQDIARGIAFLHTQNPPVIHRDLSARNVLLNSAITAKIADLGMARVMPSRDHAAMTKVPGALVYMPPEALEGTCQYNTSIDIFSLGVLIIFVFAEEFPQNLKAPTYNDKQKGLVARTELQRREEYTKTIYNTFPEGHNVIKLMESCLDNAPQARPSIDNALKLLDQALEDVCDSHHLMSKLELIHLLEKSLVEIQLQKKVYTVVLMN